MPDWVAYVRAHLRLDSLEAGRENKRVEDVARQLEDCYLEARSAGMTEREATAATQAQITDWAGFARDIEREESRHRLSALERFCDRGHEKE